MGRVVGYSRSGNLALLVRTLREHGALSRAQLAVHSGLSKATVSTLVSDLELSPGQRTVLAQGTHEQGEVPAAQTGLVGRTAVSHAAAPLR